MLAYITWNVNPELFSIGPLTIRWYGLLWVIGIWLAWKTQQKIYKNESGYLKMNCISISNIDKRKPIASIAIY